MSLSNLCGTAAENLRRPAEWKCHIITLNLVPDSCPLPAQARFLSTFSKGSSSGLGNGDSGCEGVLAGACLLPPPASASRKTGARPKGGPGATNLGVTELSSDGEGAIGLGRADTPPGTGRNHREGSGLCNTVEPGAFGEPRDMETGSKDITEGGGDEAPRRRKRCHTTERSHAERSPTEGRATRAMSARAAAAAAAVLDRPQPAPLEGVRAEPTPGGGPQETAELTPSSLELATRNGRKGSARSFDAAGSFPASNAGTPPPEEARSMAQAPVEVEGAGDSPSKRIPNLCGSSSSAGVPEPDDRTSGVALGAGTSAAEGVAWEVGVPHDEEQLGPELRQVLAVLGGEVDAARAAELLQQGRGSPRAAVNAYFDALATGNNHNHLL